MHAPLTDIFDPNTWADDEHEYRIYGDDRASVYAVVDREDYLWAVQWRWSVKRSRATFDKFYLRRAVGENAGGQRLRTFTLYLHVEIMKRTGILPQSRAHCIVDHRNGDSLHCRRKNLRWATHSMNSFNLFDNNPYDLEELMDGSSQG